MKVIEFINNENLSNEVKELFNNYYKLYKEIENSDIEISRYAINDEVYLQNDTLLHGIKSYNEDKLKSIHDNGIIFSEYYGNNVVQQKYCVCLWIMNKKTKLADYINYYSGDTIYLKERFKKNRYSNIYIPLNPYDGRDKVFSKINYFKYKIYYVHESKENRFMPSLTNFNKSEDDYIAFIINNKFTNKIKEYDIYQGKIKIELLKKFIPEWAVERTILNKIWTQTDHELAIIFGLPSNLIEGILVGRLVEKDINKIETIKDIFPNCYICNLDGKVISSNI